MRCSAAFFASGKLRPESLHLFERERAFVRQNEKNYRRNQIWRRVTDRASGDALRQGQLVSNFAEVKYPIADLALPIESGVTKFSAR